MPRIGLEYSFGFGGTVDVHGEARPAIQVPLRAGYAYEATPIPPQTGVTNFVDADRHTVSAGAALAAIMLLITVFVSRPTTEKAEPGVLVH